MLPIRVAVIIRELNCGKMAINRVNSLNSWFGVNTYRIPPERHLLTKQCLMQVTEMMLDKWSKDNAIAIMLVTDFIRASEMLSLSEVTSLIEEVNKLYEQRTSTN